MADETKIAAEAVAEAPAKVVEAVAETAEKVVEDTAKAVKADRARARRKAKQAAPKTAKTTARKARRAKPARKPAAPKIERTKTMTFDATKLFNIDALPGTEKFQADPHWRDHILFYEYFHGDNGAGLGASHQTGWTGLAAHVILERAVLRRMRAARAARQATSS